MKHNNYSNFALKLILNGFKIYNNFAMISLLNGIDNRSTSRVVQLIVIYIDSKSRVVSCNLKIFVFQF